MIRFGSRTELFVTTASRLDVKPGDHVKGGQTILGYLPQPKAQKTLTKSTRGENVEL